MKWLIVTALTFVFLSSGCSSRKAQAVITFSPISIDVQKLSQSDYSEVISTVNASYDDGKHKFTKAELIREESIFLYLKCTADGTEECCRVSIDKNKKAIVNMQPDCPVSK